MLFRSDSVRHKFPLQATYFRRVLPHVRGFPTLGVLRSIRLPISIRELKSKVVYELLARLS